MEEKIKIALAQMGCKREDKAENLTKIEKTVIKPKSKPQTL